MEEKNEEEKEEKEKREEKEVDRGRGGRGRRDCVLYNIYNQSEYRTWRSVHGSFRNCFSIYIKKTIER